MSRPRRIALCVVAAGLLVASSTVAVAAGARRAADVDMATVAAGSLGRSSRASGAVTLPIRADLVGATWDGPADELELRARTRGGSWSRWVHVSADTGHGPDPATREDRRSTRRRAVDPVYVGAADQVQLRAVDASPARDVRIVAINATGTATRTERLATSAREQASWVLGAPTAEARPYVSGGIRSRASWQARSAKVSPDVADELRGVVVHHTDGTNNYSCSQVPALLRGIQRYHMVTNGWNDIGYNYLIDRCGGVWEGRGGGITRPVVGAHSRGFNTHTAGIALMGTHSYARPTARARLSLRRLVAWRLDIAHVKPTGNMFLTARSGDKYETGSRVRVRAVSGHRDLFPTACPGGAEYRDLRALARQAWALGGPKVANLTTSYRRRHPGSDTSAAVARVNARAVGSYRDQYLAFRFERISTGELLHVQGGRGFVVRASWVVPRELDIASWDVRVVVNGARRGSAKARPAVARIDEVPDDPQLLVTTPPQAAVTPDGDGVDDELVLAYTLAREYRLQAQLLDPATGSVVADLLAPTYVGVATEPRELRLAIPDTVAAGSYELRLALPGDPAVARSLYRATVSVVR